MLSEEETKSFFKDMAGQSAQAIKVAADGLIKKYAKDEDFYEEAGAFLPLSVRQIRGFDNEDIKNNPPEQDRKDHAVLGETFRVRLLTVGSRGAQGQAGLAKT